MNQSRALFIDLIPTVERTVSSLIVSYPAVTDKTHAHYSPRHISCTSLRKQTIYESLLAREQILTKVLYGLEKFLVCSWVFAREMFSQEKLCFYN